MTPMDVMLWALAGLVCVVCVSVAFLVIMGALRGVKMSRRPETPQTSGIKGGGFRRLKD